MRTSTVARRVSDGGRFVMALLAGFIVTVGISPAPAVHANPAVEYLMVPSAAMGRDIPVAYLGGGPHAVYLLDAFNAGDDVSNWVTAGDAMNILAGKGFSVVAPAGGAYSFYTDWENDGSRQWETFLSAELPDWLVANKGLAPGHHGAVGASQGGTAALTLAEFHPDRFVYAGSMSGLLTPSRTATNGAIIAGMREYGGVDAHNMWGVPQTNHWRWRDPDMHIRRLIEQNTKIWVYSPRVLTASDPVAVLGLADQVRGSNLAFYNHYQSPGGVNGHFDFPESGDHGWSSWRPQLAAMSGDLAATIK